MKVIVLGNVDKTDFLYTTNELLCALEKYKVEILVGEIEYNYLFANKQYLPNSVSVYSPNQDVDADLAFSLGGDGTFLTSASIIGNKLIPIMGINMGRLGFLADVPNNSIAEMVDEIFSKGYKTENRTLLKLSTSSKDIFQDDTALNEIAVLKLDSSSMIMIHATINKEYFCSYQADGLILSTPTGSTAYALSVGASILDPTNQSFILAPVAPHSLNLRPFIFPDTWEVDLEIESRNNSFLVSIDGRSYMMDQATKLNIKKAPYSIIIAKRLEDTYFQTLRNKLMWGADTRHKKPF
ncbi:MAG TPA: NAD kinase [Paludibacteraceae bacterium]|nr:NAD kinase [Paludibacteraceae bacterium]HPL94612.1 NAD kinase [Paludibacteraceae bacterium]